MTSDLKANPVAIILFFFTSVFGVIKGYGELKTDVAKHANREMHAEVVAVATDLKEHKKEEAEARKEQLKAIREVQVDARSMYRTMRTGKPSPRLELPPPTPPVVTAPKSDAGTPPDASVVP